MRQGEQAGLPEKIAIREVVVDVGENLIVLEEGRRRPRGLAEGAAAEDPKSDILGVAEDPRVPKVVPRGQRRGVGHRQCWKERVAVDEMNAPCAGCQQRWRVLFVDRVVAQAIGDEDDDVAGCRVDG